jgi:glycosyltransferase involved in cell wall biosynthesis
MPTRIFEYLCMGIPTIAPRTKGVCDYFSDENIFLFEPGNSNDLAETIEYMYKNPIHTYEKTLKSIEIYKEHRWENQADILTGKVYGIR